MPRPGGLRLRILLVLLTVALVAPVSVAVGIPQSDAGSGGDAPNTAVPSIEIAPGVVYEGTLVPGSDHFDHYWFASPPAGTVMEFSVVGAATCVGAFLNATGRTVETSCRSSRGATFYTAVAGPTGFHYLRVGTGLGQATHYRFTLTLGGEAHHPILPSQPLVPGTDATCGTGSPVTATHGEGPSGLVFAALKTGFRAVVAWSTPAPTLGSFAFSVDGGAQVVATDATPRLNHVFVLDGLPSGRTLCIEHDGRSYAMRLANAMTAFDAAAGSYTVNLLVTAPENLRGRTVLEAGLEIYAEKMHDATDGWVRSGRVVVLYQDPEHVNGGTYSCLYLSGTTGAHPACDLTVDVTFSHDSCIGGAACTTRDGIQRPDKFIMMNSVYQADPILADLRFGANEVGTVLLHEFGHYGFGMDDLYVAGNCYDPVLSLSIMGSSRSVTEFDDEVHRCPNEAQLGNYRPSWTLMRQRFTQIPDRTGPIDEGPHGGGGVHRTHVFATTPGADASPEIVQDDAESGRDAGGDASSAVAIEAGRLYEATLLVSDRDVYRFETQPGDAFDAVLYRGGTCLSVTDASGRGVPGASCQTDAATRVSGVSPGGTLYLHVAQATPLYRFGVGLNAPAPGFG